MFRIAHTSIGISCARMVCVAVAACLIAPAVWGQGVSGYGGGNPVSSKGPPGPQQATMPKKRLTVTKALDEPLADVIIEGNTTIASPVILQKVETLPGRIAYEEQIREDVRALFATRWFFSVEPIFRTTSKGLVLVYRVTERPIVQRVEFKGNDGIKTKKLQAEVNLTPGHAFDIAANKQAVQRIKSMYDEKGYVFAEVDLEKGGNKDDREIIFRIKEGPKVRVGSVRFHGNGFVSGPVLKTKLATKTQILWTVGGIYDPETIPNDLLALEKYYHGLGFFGVEIDPKEQFNADRSRVTVHYNIKEGPRYKIRNINFDGNEVISNRQLSRDLKLKPGDAFNTRFLTADATKMKEYYDEKGRIFAQVQPEPTFLEEPGLLDITYRIDEDEVKVWGRLNVTIRGDHPHTKEHVVRNQANSYIQPGQLARASDLQKFQARLRGSQLWEKAEPPSVNIRPVDGQLYRIQGQTARGQNPTVDVLVDVSPFSHLSNDSLIETLKPTEPGHTVVPRVEKKPASEDRPQAQGLRPLGLRRSTSVQPQEKRLDFDHWKEGLRRDSSALAPAELAELDEIFEPVHVDFQPLGPPPEETIIRAQSPDATYRAQNVDQFGLPIPQNYIQGVSPQGDPFGDALSGPRTPGFVDVDVAVTEARTGRLMFGVGVNSDAGVVGSIILDESNFDIGRPPRSFADFANGTAFRGGGQSFRIEAVPGSEVSRYLVSWQDPFFRDTDYSLGLSGYYYNRFYQDYTEDRLGGRITVGKLFNRFWTFSTSLRLENVKIRDIVGNPSPSDLLEEARGDNFLANAEFTLAHDTRDSAFLPSQGHQLQGTYEQGFGDFVYPRFEGSASQFFTIYERPDGNGKQILSISGQVGFTGSDTPIFERFYLGGFQTFRGFEFRGVTPRDNGIRTGGRFMLAGSVEYNVPVTASDAVRVVAFTDFGTVEEDVSIDNFRVTAGAGLRLSIPALGPAPIALDFAFPIASEDEDNERVFSFYVGFTR